MRLLNKQLKPNDQTFAPELELVVRIPMQLASDIDHVPDSDFYEKLGRELASLIEK